MGFRNPLTSATAVDTGQPTSAGVRTYQQATSTGTRGVVEFRDGITGDAPSRLTAQANLVPQGGGGYTAQGGFLELAAGSWNGVTGPALTLAVEENPTGGYRSQARLSGPLAVAGRVTSAPPVKAEMSALTLNTPTYAAAGGRSAGAYIDAAGFVQLDALINNASALAQGTGGQIIGNVPSPMAPAGNRWFLVPIYPAAAVALIGVRAAGTIVLDLVIAGAVAASSFFDLSVIRYNPVTS